MKKLAVYSVPAAAACAAVAAALCAVPAVLAQEAPAAKSAAAAGLEEITVTARRREEALQSVPIAITAFSQDSLAVRGAADLSALAEVVPSVTLEPSRATNSTLTAFIRGVGQQDPLAGFEQGVALYLDDVYVARPQGALLDIYDVERIEVLRGPQGTLYGRNAVGGAIKYVTRRLSEEADFRFRATYGTYNQLDLVGIGSVPLGDKFRVGAAVASLNRDGYGDNRTTGDGNYDKDVLALRASAEFEPTDEFLVRVAYDYTDDDSAPVAGYRPFPGTVSGAPVLGDLRDTLAGAADQPSTAGINGNQEVQAEGLSLAIDWELGDRWLLRSITAWREDETESVIDFDSLQVMDFDAPVIYDNEQFSEELQAIYQSDRLDAVLGFYYLDASAANDFDVVLGQLAGGIGVTAYTGGKGVDTKAWSLFADVTYDITDQWAVSVGGRYTEDERTADVFRATYLGIGSPFFGNDAARLLAVSSDFKASRTYDDFSPRLNLSYELNDDVLFYAGYSQGWKAGSFDPRGANFLTPEVEKGFDPETLDSYEAGMKATWAGGRLRTNVALFYSDYQDMQIPGSVGVDSDGDGVNDGFVGTVTNAGQSTIQGIEFEGVWRITDRLTGQLAMSFLDPEIDEWIVNGVNVADDRKIQNTPDTMLYAGLDYGLDLASGTLTLHADWSYKSDIVQFEVSNDFIDQDSYELVSASVVWESEDGHWWLGLHGRNLTDEDVRTAGYCFGTAASTGCPSAIGLENNLTVFYGPPRTYSATIGYHF
jgi:iron complex outermembrane receptor protein